MIGFQSFAKNPKGPCEESQRKKIPHHSSRLPKVIIIRAIITLVTFFILRAIIFTDPWLFFLIGILLVAFVVTGVDVVATKRKADYADLFLKARQDKRSALNRPRLEDFAHSCNIKELSADQ